MIGVVALVVIEKGKILLVRKKDYWILPGGKIEKGESEIECLLREFKEELPKVKIKRLQFYNVFYGNSPQRKKPIFLKVYLGEIEGEITPSSEIEEACFVKDPLKLNLVNVTRKVILSLIEKGYLKN